MTRPLPRLKPKKEDLLLDRFEVKEVLAKRPEERYGQSKDSFRALDNTTGKEVRVEIAARIQELKENYFCPSALELDSECLSRLDHPSIIKQVFFHKDETEVMLVTEWAGKYSLSSFLSTEEQFLEPAERGGILLKTIEALSYAADLRIFHLAFSTDNVFLKKTDPTSTRLSPMLRGFSIIDNPKRPKHKGPKDNQEFTRNEDIERIGLIAFQLFSDVRNQAPWATTDWLFGLLSKGLTLPTLPETTAVPYWVPQFVERCTSPNLAKRFQSYAEMIEFLNKHLETRVGEEVLPANLRDPDRVLH